MDSDSSDEEWVVNTTLPTQSKSNHFSAKRLNKRLTISDAAIRTIKANLPSTVPKFSINNSSNNNNSLLNFSDSIKLVNKESVQYISDNELQTICTDMNSHLLVVRLVEVYKNCEIYFKIREIETTNSLIEVRLRDYLHLSSDPCLFIINCLMDISNYFISNPKNKDLTSRFRRLLVCSVCSALSKFLDTPLDKRIEPIQERDLISFDEQLIEKEPADLISFDDIEPEPIHEASQDSYSDLSSSEEEIITLSELPSSPDRYSLTRDHQIQLLKKIDTIPTPIVLYYALDVFRLSDLISLNQPFESEGLKLTRALIKHGYYDEAVSTIRKLNLFERFPVRQTADQFFTAGHGTHLPTLYSDQPNLQRELLTFIDKQLRFNYAGNLGIVPAHHFQDLQDDPTPQLSRLKERKFQKDLVNCATKIIKELQCQDDTYYFISLSQRYARLRFILAQRVIQQLEDGDLSIEASSNFNGLIDLVCQDDPVLARLAIKELIDTGDAIAPAYFASLYHQQEFYCRYNALPLNQRLLGVVKGEQLSRHRTTFSRRKPATPRLAYYQLPAGVKRVVVDSKQTLMEMKEVLSVSNVCGLDTEWVPGFAKAGDVKTALMQIATDIEGYVFLLDLKTIFEPENQHLYRITEIILKLLFEDEEITKLAFDFSGDLDLLHHSLPSSKNWQTKNFIDFKSLKTLDGSNITGGLAGVVSSILGLSLNKKQQLSNWEKRPLTEDQLTYGAIDSYCLLDVYHHLCEWNHPFIKNIKEKGEPSNTLINIRNG